MNTNGIIDNIGHIIWNVEKDLIRFLTFIVSVIHNLLKKLLSQ